MASTTSISKIRGITPDVVHKLNSLQISNTEQFLAAGATPQARRDLAQRMGEDPKMVLELLNRADLDRVNGIGEVYANLLEEAGVDTVKELARRVPENLHATILEINGRRNLTGQPPSVSQITTWVNEAKSLPVILTY